MNTGRISHRGHREHRGREQRLSSFPRSPLCSLWLILLLAPSAPADEITSNGFGGGVWSDPASWRGNKTPGPADEVVIRKNDIIRFDRANDGTTCKKLLIDPKGGFAFQPKSGKLVLAVEEGIESFGVIRLDGTKATSDRFEIRLVGDAPMKRVLKLRKGSALFCYGHPEKPNVALAAIGKDAAEGLVETEGAAMIDLLRADVSDLKIVAKKLDNTGAKPNERIKVIASRFTGRARLSILECDTPEVRGNHFKHTGAKRIAEPAINLSFSPLSDVQKNVVAGGFMTGITITYQGDSVLIGNRIEKCDFGVTGGYGIPNTMIKETVVTECDTGMRLEGATGVVEDLLVEKAMVGFHQQNSILQLSALQIKDLQPKGTAILYETGVLTLLDANVAPEQVKFLNAKPVSVKKDVTKGRLKPEVRSLRSLVIGVTGAPAGSLVEVRSKDAKDGAADPDVRNSPAAVIDGRTPPPTSLTPLIVEAWSLADGGKAGPDGEYRLRVLGPAAKEGAERPVLKTLTFRAAELPIRPRGDASPSLEVKVP
jgi:hypothetical protein